MLKFPPAHDLLQTIIHGDQKKYPQTQKTGSVTFLVDPDYPPVDQIIIYFHQQSFEIVKKDTVGVYSGLRLPAGGSLFFVRARYGALPGCAQNNSILRANAHSNKPGVGSNFNRLQVIVGTTYYAEHIASVQHIHF